MTYVLYLEYEPTRIAVGIIFNNPDLKFRSPGNPGKESKQPLDKLHVYFSMFGPR